MIESRLKADPEDLALDKKLKRLVIPCAIFCGLFAILGIAILVWIIIEPPINSPQINNQLMGSFVAFFTAIMCGLFMVSGIGASFSWKLTKKIIITKQMLVIYTRKLFNQFWLSNLVLDLNKCSNIRIEAVKETKIFKGIPISFTKLYLKWTENGQNKSYRLNDGLVVDNPRQIIREIGDLLTRYHVTNISLPSQVSVF